MTIDLDVARCRTVLDVGRALKAALRSSEGHGNSIDAFLDSMIWGGMNAVEPPYKVRIFKMDGLPDDVVDWIKLPRYHLADAREEFREQEGHDVEVEMELVGDGRVAGAPAKPLDV